MAARKSTISDENGAISVIELDTGEVTAYIIGTSPLIFNRMAEKAKRDLLLPFGRKTAADKAQQLKHDPLAEFRASVYRNSGDSHPTRLKFPAPGFKGVLETAALEVPGAKKAQIGRLTWVTGTHVHIYGVPQLLMSVVRSADMNKTPDIRTRAILQEWCCEVTLNYVRPTLTMQAVANLLAAGGLLCGIGDFRQEKGAGNYGQFRLAQEGDEDFARIMAFGSRDAQDAALAAADPYDEETAELLIWYTAEIERRGRQNQLKAAA